MTGALFMEALFLSFLIACIAQHSAYAAKASTHSLFQGQYTIRPLWGEACIKHSLAVPYTVPKRLQSISDSDFWQIVNARNKGRKKTAAKGSKQDHEWDSILCLAFRCLVLCALTRCNHICTVQAWATLQQPLPESMATWFLKSWKCSPEKRYQLGEQERCRVCLQAFQVSS